MTTASRLEAYMMQRGVQYEVLPHPRSHSSMETAELAHVPGDCLVKSVILEDDEGYVMAVLPSTHHVEIGKLSRELNRRLGLATETELMALFGDCETGAVPPVGFAYGMMTVIDDSLAEKQELYFEAGDHRNLIHVNGDQFRVLMDKAVHAHFCYRL